MRGKERREDRWERRERRERGKGELREKMSTCVLYKGHFWLKSGFTVPNACLIFMFYYMFYK